MLSRVDTAMVTSANDLPGYRIVRTMESCEGSSSGRAASLETSRRRFRRWWAATSRFSPISARRRARMLSSLMLQHAAQHGANAVVAMRYDATEVMHGVTEVLAYGTAVQVERAQ